MATPTRICDKCGREYEDISWSPESTCYDCGRAARLRNARPKSRFKKKDEYPPLPDIPKPEAPVVPPVVVGDRRRRLLEKYKLPGVITESVNDC